ncbi:MAG: AAA family ATPase [Campylobacterales bacterium]
MRRGISHTGLEVFAIDKNIKDIATLWMLRFILRAGLFDEFIDKKGIIIDDSVALFLGLGKYVNGDDDIDRKEIKELLAKKLQRLESKKDLSSDRNLEKNLDMLASKVGLSLIQKEYLKLVLICENFYIAERAFDMLRNVNFKQHLQATSIVLDTPFSILRKELSRDSKLFESGILEISIGLNRDFTDLVDFPCDSFAERMFEKNSSVEMLMDELVVKTSPSSLKLKDFNHLKDDISMLVEYLKDSTTKASKGVNILLYGYPGTGKTELVKTIADEIGAKLYEVAYEDSDGEPLGRDKRLRAYKAAQSFFGDRDTLFLFDEVEDVFSSGGFFVSNQDKVYKAWINRALESNTTPTIWVSNDIDSIDDAMIRRFDIALEIPVPPRSVREEMIKRYGGSGLSKETIKKVATHEHISPAVIERASKVAKSVSSSGIDMDSSFTKVAQNTLIAQGHKKFDAFDTFKLPPTYNPNYINTDVSIEQVVEGITMAQSARLCLYGAPGTGKSALGRYLAEMLDRPLHLKKGSDLLSMWLGGTEANIARAFEEAKQDSAVLVFDEVDSFLQDRRDARHSWEVTQVNEMLTQMESFEGVFIATTNLKDNLDQASLRRFDLKLEFRALSPSQALSLFIQEARALGISPISKATKAKVERLDMLTPGDFAAIKRQARFRPIVSAEDMLARLQEEIEAKESSGVKMGFMS